MNLCNLLKTNFSFNYSLLYTRCTLTSTLHTPHTYINRDTVKIHQHTLEDHFSLLNFQTKCVTKFIKNKNENFSKFFWNFCPILICLHIVSDIRKFKETFKIRIFLWWTVRSYMCVCVWVPKQKSRTTQLPYGYFILHSRKIHG